MKKILSVLFVVAMLVGCMIPSTVAAAGTPEGNAISSVADFEAMTDGTYYLANDIDFAGKEYTNYIIKSFSGTLDGNGKTIKNIKISATADGGIFESLAATANTTVKNLAIDDVTITLQTAEGRNTVGTLAGFQGAVCEDPSDYTLTLENLNVTGVITGYARAVGGLLGCAKNVTVRNCHTYGEITVEDSGALKLARHLGGLFGETREGVVNIYNSSNSIDITIPDAPGYKAYMQTAGFVGVNALSDKETDAINIYNSVNFGNIYNGNKGRNQHGSSGFVGMTQSKSLFSGCVNFGTLTGGYWNGGIVAWNSTSTSLEVKDCIVYGTQINVGSNTNAGAELTPYVGYLESGAIAHTETSCVDKRGVLPSNIEAVKHLEVIDVQSSAVASDKFSFRIVSGLTKMNTCKKIGFEVTTYVKSGESFAVKSVANKECKYVFTSLTADNASGITETLKAESFGAEALFALTIDGAPAAANNGLFVVVVRPYSVNASDAVEYGKAVAVAYDAGALVNIGIAN